MTLIGMKISILAIIKNGGYNEKYPGWYRFI